jgi:hypothetical protein
LPIESDENKRFNVKIGQSMAKVDFNLFCNLVAISYERINLDLEDLNLEEMIKDSRPIILNNMLNYDESKVEDSLVHQMVNYS